MARNREPILIVSVLVVVLAALAIVMAKGTYDLWAGVLLIPILAGVSLSLLRVAVRRDIPHLYGVLALGFFVKMAGTILRYYVFSRVYGSVADATLYYKRGSELAAAVRGGRLSILDILPLARELNFLYRLSGLTLFVTGPTQLGAFLVFGTLGYWGVVLIVKAACRSIPGLEQRRFALLCMWVPSVVFWPSSLGKEAWILFASGVLALGLSHLYLWTRPVLGLVLAALGALGIGALRIHLAAVFLVGAAFAFVQGLLLPESGRFQRRRGGRFALAVVSLALMSAVAYSAVNRLGLSKDGGDFLTGLDSALNRAATMSETGGSAFTPINAKNPVLWPWAIVRTLTRPLPTDVNSLSAVFPALETSAFLIALVAARRRLANIGACLRRSTFLAYCLATSAVFGLVFSAFGNLGILVRQRSLVVPYLLLLLCLPARASRAERHEVRLAQAIEARDQRPGAAASRA